MGCERRNGFPLSKAPWATKATRVNPLPSGGSRSPWGGVAAVAGQELSVGVGSSVC